MDTGQLARPCGKFSIPLLKLGMRGVLRLVLMGLVGLHIAAKADPAMSQPAACPESASFETPEGQLDHFQAAVRSGNPVNILALGSASSADGAQGFVSHAIQALRTALPRVNFHLTVFARHGMTADEMLSHLKEALAQNQYPLVLWQTGTVEAVEGARPEEFASELQEGAELIVAQNGNLVLIDQQFSRFLRANTDLRPYSAAIEAAASIPGAGVFRRYDLMHAWVDDGALDVERTPRPQAAAVVARLHHCLGDALARYLLAGIER